MEHPLNARPWLMGLRKAAKTLEHDEISDMVIHGRWRVNAPSTPPWPGLLGWGPDSPVLSEARAGPESHLVTGGTSASWWAGELRVLR